MIVLKKVLGRYLLLTLFALLFCGLGAKAQELTVSGTILSTEDGMGIPGVSVVIKGTTTGTVSDMDGHYSLIASTGDVLHFSFIGMNDQDITITKALIDVSMSADVVGLDEVIAIGYGTTTKRKSVGAISTMKADKLEATPFANVGNALQGQVVGLVVQNNGGGPGSAPSISIRGGGEPLYVIDGVITTADDFNALNSDDVESISFLKDASATAVYGSRAGNGIVLVTSKKGTNGKMKINYSYNYQLSEPTVLPEMLNSYDFATLQNAANVYDGTPATFSDEELETIRTHSDLDTYPDNNWPDLTLKNFATEQRHNLSLSGGDKKTNYFVSLGYIDQGGILKSNAVNYERFNIRSNMTTTFDKIGLEVGVNLNASVEDYKEPSAGMYTLWRAINQNTNPLFRAYNADGTFAGGGNGEHPIAISSKDAGYKKNRDKFINAQVHANWSIPSVKGLKLGVMANYRDGDGWGKLWAKNVPLYMQDGSVQAQPAPSLTVDSYYSRRLYFETSASYANTFGKHGVEATFVYNQSTSNYEEMSAYRRDYLSGAVDQLFAGPVDGKDNDGTEKESANAGYVFRVKYDYDYKYIFEMSGRYDGNDNFAKGKKWGFFPATSVAWNISEENFMESLSDKNIINRLKLRASYGETGVVEGVNRFGYIPSYNLESSAYNIGNSLVNGYSEGDLVDPDQLTWYTRKSLNYGLDFSSLNNKLSGSFEYFFYKTTGYLQSPENTYSQALGKDLPQIKSKSEQRRAGYEISLRYKGKVNELQYEVGVNYSYFNQLWKRLDTEDEATLKNPYLRETNRTDYWAGGEVYLSDGLYQNSDEFLNAPRLPGSTQTQSGDIRYQDVNGDGKIDEQDKRIVGLPSQPHGNYGIDFSLKYKGWFMNGLFQGTGNRYMAFDNFMVVEAKRRTYEYQKDFWTQDNPNALYPRVSHLEAVNGGNNSNTDNKSDFYLKNAKYFRMKNLQIGYDMKNTVLANVSWISSCKMYLNGTNLFTISDVMDYFDPEQKGEANTGAQTYGYPVQRTYSLGINVGF
ncbi:SusC/RagA family TonB-linked outer membrane protein [Labilibaculum antarcticum]|nr:TonB-dependent receptor [Labilibaculum antarcticum]